MVGSSGFASHWHIVKLGFSSGTSGNNIQHSAGKQGGGGILNDGSRFFISFQKYIAVVVKNLSIKRRAVVDAAVCYSGECSAQLIIIYTFCQTAESDGLHFVSFLQSSKAKVFCILITQRWCNFINRLNSTDILGLLNGFSHCNVAHITAGSIFQWRAIGIMPRLIADNGCECFTAGVQCRSIGGQNLKTRARLPWRTLICPV